MMIDQMTEMELYIIVLSIVIVITKQIQKSVGRSSIRCGCRLIVRL